MRIQVIIWLIFLASCGIKKQPPSNNKANQVVFDTSIIAIFPPTDKTPLKGAKPTALSQDDFLVIDSIINQAVNGYNVRLQKQYTELKKDDELFIHLRNYKRQYVPVINKQGEKEVWVNCLCYNELPIPDWKTQIVIVFDGGHCYFDIRINLTTKKTTGLSVNGYG